MKDSNPRSISQTFERPSKNWWRKTETGAQPQWPEKFRPCPEKQPPRKTEVLMLSKIAL